MKVIAIILLASACLIANTNALSCITCTNCSPTNFAYQNCAANQVYCYTQTTNGVTTAGCASTCVAGASTTCCTTNYCNNLPVATTTRPTLYCYACNGACTGSSVYTVACASNQYYCFSDYTYPTYITAGCATACQTGANVRCCSSNYCNYPLK